MGDVFNQIGRRTRDLGLLTTVHPHTGTLIEKPEEIDAVLGAIDAELVGFAPDTGQIAKAGGDPLAVLRKHAKLLKHMHLKDYGGGAETDFHAGYTPVGSGVIDMPGVFDLLEQTGFDGWVMVELEPPSGDYDPKKAAEESKRYLENLLGERVAW
jgi:inosose dehydratase